MTLKKRKSKLTKKETKKNPVKTPKAPIDDAFLAELDDSPLLDDPLKEEEPAARPDDESN